MPSVAESVPSTQDPASTAADSATSSLKVAAVRTDGYDPVLDRPRFATSAWFIGIHLACLLAIFTGVSWTAGITCFALYAVRMFALTGGYHRYFAHRSYETSRVFRFVLAVLGTLAIQKGPLWWASAHRQHHRASDQPGDPHSPVQRGFWWAHIGWILGDRHNGVDLEDVRDLAKYPELRWLDKWHLLPPFVLAVGLYGLGAWLGSAFPGLHTSGAQLLVWGMAISTVLLYHGVFCVNSLVHMWGARRYHTTDDSRNNALVAIWTFGEGWHNNHHRYSASERQGFRWWQLDISHLVLRTLSFVRLVKNLKRPPKAILEEGRKPKRSRAAMVAESVATAVARRASDPAAS